MSFRKEGKLVVFRLEDGKDVIESLKRVAKENQVQSGVVLSGIGMLRDLNQLLLSRENGLHNKQIQRAGRDSILLRQHFNAKQRELLPFACGFGEGRQ